MNTSQHTAYYAASTAYHVIHVVAGVAAPGCAYNTAHGRALKKRALRTPDPRGAKLAVLQYSNSSTVQCQRRVYNTSTLVACGTGQWHRRCCALHGGAAAGGRRLGPGLGAWGLWSVAVVVCCVLCVVCCVVGLYTGSAFQLFLL
jgi:hypothetical protein